MLCTLICLSLPVAVHQSLQIQGPWIIRGVFRDRDKLLFSYLRIVNWVYIFQWSNVTTSTTACRLRRLQASEDFLDQQYNGSHGTRWIDREISSWYLPSWPHLCFSSPSVMFATHLRMPFGCTRSRRNSKKNLIPKSRVLTQNNSFGWWQPHH